MPQHCRPLDLAKRRVVAVETLLCGLEADAFGYGIETTAGGHRHELDLTRLLQMMQDAERQRDRARRDQQAVVAQDHRWIRTQIAHQPRAFVEIEGEPLVIVIAEPLIEQLRVLRQRQQSFLQHRDGDAGGRMGVDHAARIVAPAMHRAVNDEPRLVYARIAAIDHVSIEVDPHQIRGRHLIERHAEGVEQEMLLRPRHARGDVGEYQIGPAEQRHQAIAGGELHPRLPFLRGKWRGGLRSGLGFGGHTGNHSIGS